MITRVLFGTPVVRVLGKELLSIISSNSSSLSNMLSLLINTLKDTLISPAGIVMLYGPEL